jgi:hypothetical protein
MADVLLPSEIRSAAMDAYAGWAGWNHNWHWPHDDDGKMVTVIQKEAVEQAAAMRVQIEHLRQQIRKCEILAGQAGEYIRVMMGEVDDG